MKTGIFSLEEYRDNSTDIAVFCIEHAGNSYFYMLDGELSRKKNDGIDAKDDRV